MEKHFKLTYLLDIYGALLTDKQNNVLSLFYNEDYSMSEVASELKVSRQAAFDLIRRSENILLEYDEKLMLFEKYLGNLALCEQLEENLQGDKFDRSVVDSLIENIKNNL